jgi:LysM repeat protein
VNEDDDFERTVARSLRQRTRAVDGSIPDLNGVWDHLDRRRRRRRHVAAVGSVAIVAVGALGIASLGGSEPDGIPAPAAASSDAQAAWRCTDQLDYFEANSPSVFFATCESVTIDGGTDVLVLPTPTTPSDGTLVAVPMTTVPVEEITYIVRSGDTLASVAAAFGMSVDEIVALNQWGGRSDVTLVEGETILIALTPIPTVPMTTIDIGTTTTSIVRSVPFGRSPAEQQYVVAPDDSITSIAMAFDVTAEQLVNYNEWPEGVAHTLLIGDTIMIPPGAAIAPTSVTVPTTTSVP